MINLSPRDQVAFIIAAGLIGWGLVLLIGITIRGRPLSESGGEIFLAIATGLTTALGAYFATRNGGAK
jgi:hypothetical protein